jgi:hypothetical protein
MTDEKKETQEIQEEEKGKTEEKATPTIKETDEVATRLKEENDRREDILRREEDLYAKRKLGGDAEAGQKAPEKVKLSDEEYATQVEKGLANPMKEDGFI